MNRPKMYKMPNGQIFLGCEVNSDRRRMRLEKTMILTAQFQPSPIVGGQGEQVEILTIADSNGTGDLEILFPNNIIEEPLTDEQASQYEDAWVGANENMAAARAENTN